MECCKSRKLASVLDVQEDYRKYLYAKGYLITTDDTVCLTGFPFYDLWRTARIDRFCFYLHPRQALFSVEKNQVTYFLIGHAYNPFSMKEKEEEILTEIAGSRSREEYFSKISELTGVFVTGYICGGHIYLSGDASCMLTMFYGNVNGHFYACSHSQLLGDLCGLELDDYVKKLVDYRFYSWFGIMLPGDISPYQEIKQLVPNHQIIYKAGKIYLQRFWPTAKIEICGSEKDYEEIIKKASGLLRNNMELIAKKWKDGRAAISMTGGCDSKTTLACAKGSYDQFSYFSYRSSEAEAVDAEAAARICGRLNLAHKLYVIPDCDSEYSDIEIWRMILEQNTGNIGKQNKNDVRKRIFFVRHHDFDVEVKSWVSEIVRAYYNKRFAKNRFPQKVKPRYLTAMYKVFFTERRLVRETDKIFRAYLERYYYGDIFEKVSWTDLIFWEYRVRSWNGLVISNEHPLSYDITIPYNNRKILELLLSTPLDKRIRDVCHKDIQKFMNREIADMDIAVTNLKHTDRRAKMERLYFEVQSRIPF